MRHERDAASVARARLLEDQHWRPRTERRAAFQLLCHRLEQAGRVAVLAALADRARTDARLRPLLRLLDQSVGLPPVTGM